MSTFVLVHGAWHGGWSWDKIVPLLRDAGHRVLTVDLPGHGTDTDTTAVSKVTLQDYTDHLCRVLDNESEPMILVGHSMGGLVITQTAEYRPDKIQLLVYVCAFLPVNGQSLLQILEKDDTASPLPIIRSEDNTYLKLNKSFVKDAFLVSALKMILLRQYKNFVSNHCCLLPHPFGQRKIISEGSPCVY